MDLACTCASSAHKRDEILFAQLLVDSMSLADYCQHNAHIAFHPALYMYILGTHLIWLTLIFS